MSDSQCLNYDDYRWDQIEEAAAQDDIEIRALTKASRLLALAANDLEENGRSVVFSKIRKRAVRAAIQAAELWPAIKLG